MPRKNKTPQHKPFQFKTGEGGKNRYATKQQAEKVAEHQMLINPGLELYVYKSDLDGGWYLTRKQSL